MSNGTPSGAGGVRNLRAMFEANGNPELSSPAVRGRSPAGELRNGSDNGKGEGETQRHVSKVRTNFVSVEPLKRTKSTEQKMEAHEHTAPSEAGLATNGDHPSEPAKPIEVPNEVFGQRDSGKETTQLASDGPVNDNASTPTADDGTPEPAIATETSSVGNGKATQITNRTSTAESLSSEHHKPEDEVVKSDTKTQRTSPARQPARDLKSPQLETSQAAKAQPSQTPPSRTRAEATQVTPARSAPAQAQAGASPGKPSPAKPSSGSSVPTEDHVRAKPRLSNGSTITTGGFVKPKPRSPTRPIKLPSHLTAHTASSAAKHGDMQPHSENNGARGASQASIKSHNSSVRASKPPATSKPRPAKQAAQKKTGEATNGATSVPQLSGAAASSSFLERMMRPTTSSAFKVKDKNAPPGKSSAR